MPVPTYGAAPLSKFFLLTRILELVCMIGIVGITANFVDQIVSSNVEPPQEVVGTLSVTCLAALYCLVSIAFFYSEAFIGLFVMTGLDAALTIAFIVVAVTLGRPVSYLKCALVEDTSSEVTAASAYAFTSAVSDNWGKSGVEAGFAGWAGATKVNCYETKAIWGLSIALCILFSTSCFVLPTLFFKNKKANAPPKSVV